MEANQAALYTDCVLTGTLLCTLCTLASSIIHKQQRVAAPAAGLGVCGSSLELVDVVILLCQHLG